MGFFLFLPSLERKSTNNISNRNLTLYITLFAKNKFIKHCIGFGRYFHGVVSEESILVYTNFSNQFNEDSQNNSTSLKKKPMYLHAKSTYIKLFFKTLYNTQKTYNVRHWLSIQMTLFKEK